MTTYSYSNFLKLTNLVLNELNEVELTSTTFGNAVGFQKVAASAVNKSINQIQNQQWEWPFNHDSTTLTLTPGVPFYTLPANTKSVDWDTFFVRRDDTLASPQRAQPMRLISYDDYVHKRKAEDMQGDSTSWRCPLYVFRTQGDQAGFSAYPNQAYTIEYEYWLNQADMINYDDLASVPDRFNDTIVDGAMYFCYGFRENLEAAAEALKAQDDGIKQMRNIYVNDYLFLSDKRAGPQFGPKY
jgi:hypothetical protein